MPAPFSDRYARKLEVNDVVHTFCYFCRHPSEQPLFLLQGWEKYTSCVPENRILNSQVARFISYANRYLQGARLCEFAAAIWFIERYTQDWSDLELTYADQLLERYYGHH